MHRILHIFAVVAILAMVLGGLVACTETSALPTASSTVSGQSDYQLGTTLSPLAATVPPPPPPPTPDPDPDPEPETPTNAPLQNGDPVTVKGNVFGVSGCPDNCVLEMRGFKVRVPASTRVVLTLGGQTYEMTTADLRPGLPLKVKGTYNNGSVGATRIIIKEDIRTAGTVVLMDEDTLMLQPSNGGNSQVEFWIAHYQGIVFGNPQPGTRVFVFGKVRRDLTLPFVATRIQPE